jgi:hypothetical protein
MNLFLPAVLLVALVSIAVTLASSIISFMLLKEKRQRIIESIYGIILTGSSLLAMWFSEAFAYASFETRHWTFQEIYFSVYGLGIGLAIYSIIRNFRNKRNSVVALTAIIFSVPQVVMGLIVLSHDL